MGAFFIRNKNEVPSANPALDLFSEMGFASPVTLEIGEWVIYAYPKMVAYDSNIVTDKGCTLISTGTPIYKGLDYAGSLRALLCDYLSVGIDNEQLIGQYTILFCYGTTIEVLCDPLGCKHVFTDLNHSILSSHMLPICQCIGGDLHINRKAFYEKFLTGIIMPPNTMFEEIIQIDKHIADHITREGKGIWFTRTKSFYASGTYSKSFKECLAEQADTLRQYFELLSKAGENGIDIGLSGGYDSRLVLACLNNFFQGRIHLHSHATENVHRKDLTIANQMADYVGVPCHTVATKKLCHCDHVDEVTRKSILYFDGRSSFSIGGCGEVYTALYRKESTERVPFTLTGVGGELYRNIFDIGFRNIRFDRFMEEKVFSRSFRNAIPDNQYRKVKEDIICRASIRLGIDLKKRQSKLIAHRYYCEIMMPDGQGVALDAYNQVSCCVAPFLEPQIISKGYEAIPFHHSGGEFEGKLIDVIDPGIAAIPSSYGYSICKRPVKAMIKEKLRAYIPTSMWNRLAEISHKKVALSIESAKDQLYNDSQTLKEAYIFLTELFPEIKFECLLQSNEDIRKVQFVAMTIYFFKRRLKINDGFDHMR